MKVAGVVRALVALVLVSLFTVSVQSTARFARADEPGPPLVADGPVTKDGKEITALRTRNARTFQAPTGSLVAVIGQGSVNFKDAQGQWQPIDNKLYRDGATIHNGANRYRVELPEQLGSAPIKLEHGGDSIAFSLRGANAEAAVDGATAAYANALRSTAVRYTAASDSVKEALVVTDGDAPTSFVFELAVSAGLTARSNGAGGIAFDAPDGTTRFTIAAPYAVDARGKLVGRNALSYALDGTILTLNVDRSFYKGAKFPVTIDPTFTLGGADQDCFISSASPTSSFRGGQTLDVGLSGSDTRRALLKFDLVAAGVPKSAIVLDTNLSLYLGSAANGTPVPVTVHRVDRAWDSVATTWNNADPSTAWTTPGGDFNPVEAGKNGPTNVTTVGQTYRWRFTQLAQSWVNGSVPNNGLLVKEQTENVQNVLHFASTEDVSFLPELRVTYEFPIGQRRLWVYDDQNVNDRSSFGVNVANGNLVIAANDLHVNGTGMDLEISRYYNSLAAGRETNGSGDFGYSWQMGTGADVYFKFYDDGSGAFYGPGGYAVPFVRTAQGDYVSPTAIDAFLNKNGDGSYTLTSKLDEGKLNFDASGRLTSQVDGNGNRIAFAYNGNGTLASITDTQGRVTTFAYNASAQLTQITDSSGRLFKYAYSGANLTQYTDPGGGITKYTWSSGVLTKLTDPRGNVTKFNYDLTSGRVTSIVRLTTPTGSTGPTTTFTYNADNTVVTDENSHQTTHYFDAQGRITRAIDAKGNQTSSTYTSDSNIAQFTDAGSGLTDNQYDANDNLTQSTAPTGAVSKWEYASTAHPFYATKFTDPENNALNYGYDSAGNLTSMTNGLPTQNSVSFTYNPNGTVATATDAKGTVTSYGYDALGNLTSIDYPVPLGDVSFTYDNLSRVRTFTDGKGQTSTFTYDVLDRVTSATYGDTSSVTSIFDKNGNRTSLTDATGTSIYTYDFLNRLTQESLPGPKTNSYTWDNASNLLTFTDAGGTVNYAYDVVNLVSTMTQPGGSQITFVYDAKYNRTQTNYPNGVSQFMTYDGSNRLTSIIGKKPASGIVLSSFTYTYTIGTTDTMLRQTVTDKDGNVTTYSYDAVNRLTRARTLNSGGTQIADYQYTYDGNGNRTSQTVDGTTTNYTYNAANELTSDGTTTYTYDTNGNMTGGRTSYTYNAKDQTTTIAGTSMSYAGTNQYERVSAGSIGYTNSILGLTREDTTSYTRDPRGMLLSERLTSGTYFYLYDGVGSTVALIDGAGNVANTYSYEPYGSLVSSTGTVSNPWRFTGSNNGYYDALSGLYKIGARFYDPVLARWTQTDPVRNGGRSGVASAYSYADDDPVNHVDPDGLRPVYPCDPEDPPVGWRDVAACEPYNLHTGVAFPHAGRNELIFLTTVIALAATRNPLVAYNVAVCTHAAASTYNRLGVAPWFVKVPLAVGACLRAVARINKRK